MIYELADKSVKEIKKLCDIWEVYITNSKIIEVESKKDILNFAKEEIENGVGIRVIKDGKMGFAYTSNLDKIEKAATNAINNAKLNKSDDNNAFTEVEKVPEVKGTYDKKIDDLSVDECCDYLNNMIGKALENGCEVSSSGFSANKIESIIINSNDVSIHEVSTGFSGGLSVNIEENGKFATAYDYTNSRFFDIEYEKLTNDVCKLAKDSLYTKPIETNNYSVVLDYYAASGLLQTFIQAFNGENVLRGRSLLSDKLNQEIVNPNLSITDNPLLEKAMGSSKSDEEGTASKKTNLIENGVLKSFLYDIYNANKAGCETTSNGYRGLFYSTPEISPSNLVFDFKEDVELDEIEKGVITTSVLGAHTANPISGDFSVEMNNAFKIENGEICDGITKAMLSGNIFDIMKKCEALKSEVKQYGSFIIPKLLVHDLKVIGID